MKYWPHLHSSNDAVEEQAESYVLGRMSGADHRRLYEEHLLVCQTCQTAVQTVEEFIQVFRATVAARSSRTMFA